MEKKFYILDFLNEASIESKVLDINGTIECVECSDEDYLPDYVEDCEGLIAWHYINITKRTLDRLKNCKVIARAGVGYNNVDFEYAGKLGIPVVNVPDYGTNEVADHALALLLSAARRINIYHDELRISPKNGWNYRLGGEIRRLQDSVLGVVGLGRIGTAVAMRAKAFGLKVVFYDPYKSDGYDKAYNIERAESLEELVKISDYLSINCLLSEETTDLINSEILHVAKTGLILVNTARGGVVSLDAVYESIKSGKVSCFAADVMPFEPPTRELHPLIAAYEDRAEWLEGKMILTPHAAFHSETASLELRHKSAMHMLRAAKNQTLINCINYKYLENSRICVNPDR